MLSIAATFENSDGKKRRLRMKDVNPNGSAEDIKTSLEKLTAVNLFEKDGVNLFQEVVGAKFIDKIEIVIFDEKTGLAPEPMLAQEDLANNVPAEEVPLMIDPRELIVEEKLLQTGLLMQIFELPEEVDSDDLSQDEALSLIMAIMPPGGTLEDISMQEEGNSERFKLIVRLAEEK